MSVKENTLTICSVLFPTSKYLKLNLRLIQKLNKHDDWKWLITDNSGGNLSAEWNPESKHIVFIKGDEPETNIPEWRQGTWGSYRHAAGLNKILPFIDTRFVVFLDHDFFIVRQDWITEILQHMKSHDLAFFGAPWHPRSYTKYRYFPCVQCMFIDLAKVPLSTIDFTPNFNLKEPNSYTGNSKCKKFISKTQRILKYYLNKNLNSVVMGNRSLIATSHDTGYRIYQKHHQSALRSECIIPVLRRKPQNVFQRLGWKYQGFIEQWLPDYLCYIPKQKESFTYTGFHELGFPDLTSTGWEEFLWHAQPFGFHLRCNQRSAMQIQQEYQLSQILDHCVDLIFKASKVSLP